MLSLCRSQRCIPLARSLTKRYASKNARSKTKARPVTNTVNNNADQSSTTRTEEKENAMKAMQQLVEPLERFTRNMIETSANRMRASSHNNAVDILSMIPQTDKPTQIPSLEKSQFLEEPPQSQFSQDLDGYYTDSANPYCRPGSFVEVRRNLITTFGIIIKLQVFESRMHALTLTYTGELWPHLLEDITFSIPNFIPSDLVTRAGSEYKSLNASETAARLEVVEIVRVFARQHEREYNNLSKYFHKLYDEIHHPDPEKWTDVTLSEAVRVVDLRRPPPVLTLFALHTFMMSRPNYFIADPLNHKSSQRFSIRPLAHVRRIDEVARWIQPTGPEFEAFIIHACDAITAIKEAKAKYDDGTPQMIDLKLKPWSPTDMVFIRYLRDSLRTTRSMQKDPYTYCISVILKKLNIYKDQISPALTHRFLCDIGFLAPWDDVIMEDPQLRHDFSLGGETAQAKAVNNLIRFNIENPGKEASVLVKKELVALHLTGSSELLPQDLHADTRHDFGSLPVYVIDDDGAQELDDAMSIESIPGDPKTHWVHVHIADPTTVLSPGHVVDICAQKLGQTRYATHQTWPMLPAALTQQFSLGSLPEGSPQPVLSFSIKISDGGALLDYKIRPGLIRNIQILRYAQVDRALGVPPLRHIYPFEPVPPEKSYPSISENHLSDLRKLSDLAHVITLQSVKERNTFFFSFPQAEVSFNEELPKRVTPMQPLLWTGYPSATYTVHPETVQMHGTRNTVAQFMVFACRVSSMFCVEKGIPAIRRACLPPPVQEEVLASVLALRDEYGRVDTLECLKRDVFLFPAETTLEPRQHSALGIPEGEGYCRTTSPLRRYGDLLMHWQIKHALLPPSKRTSSKPLFPAEVLGPLAWKLHDQYAFISKMDRLDKKYWSAVYLHRHIAKSRELHGNKYNPFPELTACSIGNTAYDPVNIMTQVPVIIPSLGVQGMLRGLSKSAQIGIGTTFSVEISEIRLGLTPFITSKGNEYFCEVEEDYILDRFNLTGLNTEVQNYSQALDLITDNLVEEEIQEEFRNSLEVQARFLYGLIHARWIITSRGLAKMLEKYKRADFGRCPRVLCQSQPLLPIGLTDVPYEKSVKLYCGRCEDIYSPKSSRHGSIDGAYFGTSFPHMLFLVYPHMIPHKSGIPEMSPPLSRITDGMVGTSNAVTTVDAKKRRMRDDVETTGEGLGEGISTANAALKAERYRPKIFGFQVNEIAKLQRWQEAVRDRQITRLEALEQNGY
ncbi:hypothetical protein Clacol_002429 [Clathrus columnatus]|uniref:Casein kinase II subunit beta n=1 Tax=Clathrus columnatus TaxID=1419009 RepID=A0AAV5A1T8_9AGAM|nr:hypothetical protein Clacol_002429 [Clathrus columnatus]